MRVVVSGGGTAGHINPALAVARELKQRGCEVFYAGNPTGIEARLAPRAGLPFIPFSASGFDRSKPWTMVTSSIKVLFSAIKARSWLVREHIDVVVGFGGYVALPVGMAAHWLHIPLVVHEQNSYPGIANRALARHACIIALTYDDARLHLNPAPAARIVLTGNPVRESVLTATRRRGRELLDVGDDVTLLLVFGGSLGARHLNAAIVALKEQLLSCTDLVIVQVTGPGEYDVVRERLALTHQQEAVWKLMPYCDQMGDVLAACDMAVCRAGATTLAEVTALHVPVLLVPFPFATADHQTRNASSLVAAGAAVLVADDALDGGLAPVLFDLLDHPEKRSRMAEAYDVLPGGDAARELVDLIVGVPSPGSDTIVSEGTTDPVATSGHHDHTNPKGV
jgi:UDP-N-acetylglucosamine--N-acetylmuramyl-(pentapeptide) pyrophosphoryl-undecaprenol N-acetylglucosamine transferase